jgi:hypothetical protein
MKRLILAVVGVGVIGGAMLYLNRQKSSPVPPADPTLEASPSQTMEDPQSAKAVVMHQKQPQVSAKVAASSKALPVSPPASPALNEVKPDNSTNSTASTAFSQAIGSPASPSSVDSRRGILFKYFVRFQESQHLLAAYARTGSDAGFPAKSRQRCPPPWRGEWRGQNVGNARLFCYL